MKIIPFAAAAVLAASVSTVTANPDLFCSNYTQTSSNAGDCPTCTLLVAHDLDVRKYTVEANNGWMAELTWLKADAAVASGKGRWNDSVSGPYSGKSFDIGLEKTGTSLNLKMTHHDKEIRGTITAVYGCTD